MNDTPIVEHEKAPDGEAALRNRRETILHDSMEVIAKPLAHSNYFLRRPVKLSDIIY
jgi:hypothetical protein